MMARPLNSPITLMLSPAIMAVAIWGTAAAEEKANPPRPRPEQIVVVFKTHFDIGYTDLARNVVQRYRTTMVEDALRVVDRSRALPPEQQFVWTIPGWPMAQMAGESAQGKAETRERVLAAFKEGRFAVHALPFTLHTELLDLEDLVRGLGHSSRLSRQTGLPLPRDAKMTDVPCHSWVLPTLLRHAHVEFLHLGCNAASRSPEVPRLFWWEGPDGSRLLTMYTAESYGTGLVPPADWPYRTWLALIHTGDNHGPPTPDEVEQLLTEARQRLPGTRVRIGRLSDFADALLAEKADIPVVRGDMPDTWIHGPLCDPAGARLARNVRPEIAIAESLATQLGAWGVKIPAASDSIAAAYEKSLLYGEHTWGGALYWVTKYEQGQSLQYGDAWKVQRAEGRFRRLEESWAEHTAYIEAARDLVRPALRKQMESLAHNVAVSGRRITVYNPLPWARDGLVSVALNAEEFPAVRPADGDAVLPTEAAEGGLRFVARDVPPMGHRTYVPLTRRPELAPLKADAATHTIESPTFRLTLDPATGAVRSLVDRPSNRDWADPAAPQQLGQYLYERFSRDEAQAFVDAYVKIQAAWAVNELGKPNLPPSSEAPYRASTPAGGQISYQATPVSVSSEYQAPAGHGVPHGVVARVTLYRDLPVVDLELKMENKPADPWPEAGWMCLPLRVESPRFRLGRQSSIIDPARDIVPGANHHLLGINTGLTVTQADGRGIGICPLDSPLVSLDTPGCWKYARQFVPRRGVVYVNLFNNQWTTNFRLWNEGSWASRVRLWAVRGSDAGAGLITPSLEARFPLQAAVAQGAAGPLPAAQPGLELSRRDVLVTAFGPNPDGDGLVLRLWELAGRSGPCRAQLPRGLRATQAQPVNLRGEPTGPTLPVRDGALEVELKGFAPLSLQIRGGLSQFSRSENGTVPFVAFPASSPGGDP